MSLGDMPLPVCISSVLSIKYINLPPSDYVLNDKQKSFMLADKTNHINISSEAAKVGLTFLKWVGRQ